MKARIFALGIFAASCHPAGAARPIATPTPVPLAIPGGEPDLRLIICGDQTPVSATDTETLPFVVCFCVHMIDGAPSPTEYPVHVIQAFPKPAPEKDGVEL
jgi:hypothetical protein